MKTPFVTLALTGALSSAFDLAMNDYELDWAKDILGDYSSFSYTPKETKTYDRGSETFNKRVSTILADKNDDLYKDTFEYTSPSYVRKPTGGATYTPSTVYGLDDYKPKAYDFSY